MNSMDLHYVPALDVLRLVLRDDGYVLEVLECWDGDLMASEIRCILDRMPELKELSAKAQLPHHVCVKVWA